MANLQRLLRVGLALAFNPARIAEDMADAARRIAILSVCGLLAGLILLPAAGCAAAGLWIIVQDHLGPIWAAFITAGAFVILAAIVLLIGIVASRRRKVARARPEPAHQMEAAAAVAAAAIPAAAAAALSAPKDVAAAGRGFFNRHKGTALLAAAVIGLVVGQNRLRRRKTPPG